MATHTPAGEIESSQRISKIITTPGEQKIIKASLGSVISSGKKDEYSHWVHSQEIKKSDTHDPVNTRARDSHEVLSPVSIYKGGKGMDKNSLNISMDVNPVGDPSPLKNSKPESSRRDRVVT
mmetsp:Transcript_28512/g.43085  ORF Transcript_28512/g.43085 Transcript_28512/m.43085 type:complete len:122 (+) Transcript_28512:233-598(+)